MIKFNLMSYVSLGAGLIVGMLAQSSRMCFIGGIRDFILVRDKYLIKGFISFFLTAVVLFFVFFQMGYYLRNYPWFDRPPVKVAPIDEFWEYEERPVLRTLGYCELTYEPDVIIGVDTNIPGIAIFGIKIPYEILMYLIAAFIIGIFSTLANGCPLRQHVMASSGNVSSIVYLIGFYGAIIAFDGYLVKYFDRLLMN